MAEDLRRYSVPQFGVVTAHQAKVSGYAPREIEYLVKKEAWTRLRHGIYLPDTAPDPAEEPRGRHLVDTAAGLLAVRADDAVVAHTSAAVLWDFEWIELPDLSEVLLARPPEAKLRHYPGLRVRPAPLPPHHVTRAPNGMPVTTRARTIVDLARYRTLPEVLVAVDSLLRTRGVSRSEIDRVLAECAGWPNIRRAARHLSHADGRSESAAESLARAIFLELGLAEPELQVEFYDGRGRPIGRVDFYFRGWRIVIEIDGKGKYEGDPESLWREKRREDAIREQGIDFLRLAWADLVGDRAALVRRIQGVFARAETRQVGRAS